MPADSALGPLPAPVARAGDTHPAATRVGGKHPVRRISTDTDVSLHEY